MDPSADPCVDFYQYVCGGWKKDNPIPADQASWSVYGKLYVDNQRYLWGILKTLSDEASPATPAQRQLGDYFAACMDQARIDQLGLKPLAPTLSAIDNLQDKAGLPALIAQLQANDPMAEAFFNFGAEQDMADSSSEIAGANAGGLGLPDRDYYLKQDKTSVALRIKYVSHVQRTFVLLGDDPARAAREAQTVLRIETALAKASLSAVERRDPYKLFHKMDLKGLEALTPHFDWSAYLQAAGVNPSVVINVAQPRFFKAWDAQMQQLPLDEIKTYLRWHATHSLAPELNQPMVDENFAFYGTALRGVPVLLPRWQRCVRLTDEQLGESLGQEYVARAFSPELKARTLAMTVQIEQAMQQDLNQLSWMSAATKTQALEKLHAIVNKIGYPDHWRDYSSMIVKRDDFLGNVERGQAFERHRELNKIGRPVDRQEWGMTPPTVNAYFDPQNNDINFPAAVLQPPLFDPKMDDAPNYGNTGGTIGHELTHGFDDEGRQYDAKGNLRDWWTAADAKAFKQRAQCVVDQYARYTVVDDIKINSKLTEGEDIADLGGLVLAWMAWQGQIAEHPATSRDGLSPEQRFFVGYGQWACENQRPEALRANAISDPHSPGKYRVNGLVANMPEFARAFSCKKGQPMVNEHMCRVW